MVRRVHTHAEGIVCAETAGNVGRQTAARACAVVGGNAGQAFIGRTFRQYRNRATRVVAARRHAVEKSRRAFLHFHALEQLGGDVLARQNAVEAVVHGVVGFAGETANKVGFLEVAETARDAHGGVVLQHVAHAAGVFVLNQAVGVGGVGKRRFKVVFVAENADAAAPRHLPAAKRGHKAAFGRVRAGGYGYGLQLDDLIGVGRVSQSGGSGQQRQADGGEFECVLGHEVLRLVMEKRHTL